MNVKTWTSLYYHTHLGVVHNCFQCMRVGKCTCIQDLLWYLYKFLHFGISLDLDILKESTINFNSCLII